VYIRVALGRLAHKKEIMYLRRRAFPTRATGTSNIVYNKQQLKTFTSRLVYCIVIQSSKIALSDRGAPQMEREPSRYAAVRAVMRRTSHNTTPRLRVELSFSTRYLYNIEGNNLVRATLKY
jgi:hypothetical protein